MSVRRRDLLPGLLVFGAGLTARAAARDAAAVQETLPLRTPVEQLRDLVRMQGSLREEDVPWWFSGVIFAVTSDRDTPRPFLRFEGMEIYWFRHDSDGYFLGGHTVTFFRDFASYRMLSTFDNPWTGERNEVKPAVQGGGLGFKYTERGIWPARYNGDPLGPLPEGPLSIQWHAAGEHVWLQHQTVYPPGAPPMHGQRQTIFAPRRAFEDRRRDRLPSVFTSVVFQNWPRWMNMGDRPGHVVWHASGAKLRSIADLPSEYRARAEREFPQRMTARPPVKS
ncbi:MAG: DUF1838 domain-containing protein [Steroidobacteraceae bacterium]|nr:DUF1838 domain-containing protein [Steroidobacteraceae bacterium]MDW8258033.1 DUF1838 family protein [Gammaproteobacteria bacterium]